MDAKNKRKRGGLPFEPITLRNDAPVDQASEDSDLLNFTPLAKEVAAIAIGTGGPFTMAITAKWGYGKTSMLGLVKDLIEQYGEVKGKEWRATHTTVWFNAWQYEREEEPIVPLLLAIKDAIAESVESHQSFQEGTPHAVWNYIKKLPRALGDVASGFKFKGKIGTALWLQWLTGIRGEVEIEAEPGKALEALRETFTFEKEAALPESTFMQAMRELDAISKGIEAAAKEEKDSADRPKIVVFVDDLDRCHPDAALRLLDGIKLVLNQAGFVFVLALDKTILEEFLVRRYRREYGASNPQEVGRRYVDKIIQLEVPLPPQTGRFAGSTKDQRAFPDFAGTGYLERVCLEMLDRTYALQIADVLKNCGYLSPRDVIRLLLRLRVDIGLYNSVGVAKRSVPLEDVAVAAVLMRLVEDACTGNYRNDFLDLIADDIVGQRLWAELSKPDWQVLDEAEIGEADTGGTLSITAALIEAISQRRGLIVALSTDGGLWLTDASLRRRLLEFLRSGEEAATADSAQLELVRDAVRRSLNLRGGEPSPDDWLKITALSFTAGLNDKGLELVAKCENLQSLDLSGNRLSDLKPIAKLRQLKRLDLEGTLVEDLAPLASLERIEKLVLSGSQIVDLAPLSGLQSLRTLYIARTKVIDVSPLSNLRGLSELSLWKTPISDVSPLRELNSLSSLDLSETRVPAKDKAVLLSALPGLKSP